jgi:hypothetical protein
MTEEELRRQTAIVESLDAEHEQPIDVVDWNVYRLMLAELNNR